MATMKGVGLYRYLPIDDKRSFEDVELDKPFAKGKNLLVEVKAISVNPVDYKVRSPKSKVEESPRILGWDASGIVSEVGDDCELFSVGDEVFYAGDLTKSGSYAEYQLVDERIVGKKPNTLSFEDSAALPLTSLTEYEGLFEKLKIPFDKSKNYAKSILIIGASGGVGSIACQLAHNVGLTVIGTASRDESKKWVLEHGAEFVINHFEDMDKELNEIGFSTVDYIFCLNNTEKHWDFMVKAIKPQGKICSIDETKEKVNLSALQSKAVSFSWEFMFAKSMWQTEDLISQHYILNQIADMIDNGELKTTVTKRLSPMNSINIKEAHRLLETGRTIGKIVISNSKE